MTVYLRPKAQADLDDAAVWYESRRSGLGTEFLDSVQPTLDRISNQPFSYPKVYGEVRRALVSRFPFGIYYLSEVDREVVIAIIHGSRDPATWKNRT